MTRIKIENARFIMTMNESRRIISDGTIILDNDRIAHVGKAADLTNAPADSVIDAQEMVITPGFVNGHMHISYAHATRGIFPDDLSPRDYLANVFALQKSMTEEEEHDTTLLGITELLRGGTTTFVDPGSTRFLDACMDAYERSGCRIVVGRQVTDRTNPLNLPVYETGEAIALTGRTIDAYDGGLDGRVRAWAMPFSIDYCSPELLRELKAMADSMDTRLTLHHGNGPATVRSFLERYSVRPTMWLEDQGILGDNVVLSHVIGLDGKEVASMARTGASGILCPTAAMKMGSGISQQGMAPEMLRSGVTLGLGTDAGNNSNLVETLRSMYLIAILFKDARTDTRMIPAESALEMATIGGAKALGLDHEIGSIEPGKKADLVLFDTRRAQWRTLFNPVNSLVYNADGRSVHTVIVDGRIVVEGGEANFVDEWDLAQRVQRHGESMLERTNTSFPSRWPVM